MQTHCRMKMFSKMAHARYSAYHNSVSRWSHIATLCVLFPWCFFSPQTGCTVMLMEVNHLFLPAFRAVAPPPPDTESTQQIAQNGHGLMLTTTAKMSWNEIMQFAAEKDNRSTKRDILYNTLVSLEIVQKTAMIPLCCSFICSVEAQRLRQKSL